MTALGFLPQGSFTRAAAIAADGAVIVGNADGGNPVGLHAFRWTLDLGLTQLAGLPNAVVCAANAVSADGSVVAGTCLAPMNEAFRWTPAIGAIGLGRFGTGSNSTSTASAVSGDGAIIGGAGHPALTGAVIWDASNVPTMIGGLPGDPDGAITALSRDGTVAAGISVDAAGNERAFRRTSTGEVVPLATTRTFTATIATAISADGRRITGWGSRESGPDAAVLWDSRERYALYQTCFPTMARPQARAGHLRGHGGSQPTVGSSLAMASTRRHRARVDRYAERVIVDSARSALYCLSDAQGGDHVRCAIFRHQFGRPTGIEPHSCGLHLLQ